MNSTPLPRRTQGASLRHPTCLCWTYIGFLPAELLLRYELVSSALSLRKAPRRHQNTASLSSCLYSCPRSPPWPRWITAGSMASGEPDLETLWWNEGTPLLHIFPYSALDADLRSGLEVLERGMAKGELSRLLQEHLVTLDDLFGETRDSECACRITGDRRHHFNYDAIQKCKQKAMKDAEAAAERWMPRMVPEQEVTLEDITVTASIRKLQFLDRTSLSLEIQTRAKDSGATRGLWPGWLGFDPTDGDDPDEATVTTRVSGFEPARPLASVATQRVDEDTDFVDGQLAAKALGENSWLYPTRDLGNGSHDQTLIARPPSRLSCTAATNQSSATGNYVQSDCNL